MRTSRLGTLILAAAIFVALGVLQASAAQVLNFKQKVEVAGPKVTLLDLAQDPESLGPAMQKALAKVTVMATPSLGGDATVSGDRLRSMVESARLGSGVSMLLPQRILVSRSALKVDKVQLEAIYLDAVTDRLGARADQADIRGVVVDREYLLPQGELTTQVRFVSSEVVGRVPAMIDLLVDGQRVRTAHVTGVVDLFGPVVVARRTINRGQIVGPEDVEVVRTSLERAGTGAASHLDQVVGQKARAIITAGEALDLRRLERAALIKRGDVVTMICQAQGLTISTKGKAEETGYKDGRIKLTNLVSNRSVWGTVLDSGTVVVAF